MPTIQITDQLGVSVDAQLAPTSSFLKAAADLPHLVMSGASLSKLQILTLADPAVQSLHPVFQFDRPIGLGSSGAALTISASAGVTFQAISKTPDRAILFSPDEYGENIAIPDGTCYLGLGLSLGAGVGVSSVAGPATFGLDVSSGIAVESFRAFSAGADAPTIVDAMRQALGEYVIPMQPADLDAIPTGVIVTLTGRGSLRFSGSANLLAVANPLATASLPSPLPAVSVTQSNSVTVGASWGISAEYQVRIQKTGDRHFRLGWYRRHGSEFEVSASASAGIAAGPGQADLFPTIVGAISADPKAPSADLAKAGAPADRVAEIEGAVKAAVNRKLELSVTAAFGGLSFNQAAFLYEVDSALLDDASRAALAAALHGDMSRLSGAASPLAGITVVRDIWSRGTASHASLRINLLGIFNFGSITELALSGTVVYTPSTGELVITDSASASLIQSSAVNFGADEDKLRHLMAESFLITAAYRGSRASIAPPELSSAHTFFVVQNNAGSRDVARFAKIAACLGIVAPAPDSVPGGFGRVVMSAEANYDDAMARALFFRDDGSPRDHLEYEKAGRAAIAQLVLPDGDDAFRRIPATNDALWDRMKELGPTQFGQLLPQTQASGVRPDYLAIQWWAKSMCDTSAILARIDQFLAANPTDGLNSAAFQKLRQELAAKLRDVASKAEEQFGTPWGLAAMFLVSGARAKTSFQIVSPHLVFSGSK